MLQDFWNEIYSNVLCFCKDSTGKQLKEYYYVDKQTGLNKNNNQSKLVFYFP